MAESKLKVADKEEQIPEAIKGVFRLYGLNILTDRQKFAALLTDVVSYPFAIKMLKKICMCKELESLVGASRQDVNTIKEAIVNNLYNNEMIVKEATEKALNWIFVALDLVDAGELKSNISLPTTAGVNEDVDLNEFLISDGVLVKYIGTKINVVVPDCVVEIGQHAFSPIKLEGTSAKETVLLNLRSVTIPDSVKIINENAFYGCSQLRDVKGSAVEEIGFSAFCGCKALEKFDFGNLKKIGGTAFYGCSSLNSIVIPEGVSKIENKMFWGCSNLESVDLGNVKEIGSEAFRDCYSLKSIVIPEGVSKIESQTFGRCVKLEKVVIPNSMKEIVGYSFAETYNLKGFVFSTGVDSELCKRVDRVYYLGTKNKEYERHKNVYFYAETRPKETGQFWRYVNGVPKVWEWGD